MTQSNRAQRDDGFRIIEANDHRLLVRAVIFERRSTRFELVLVTRSAVRNDDAMCSDVLVLTNFRKAMPLPNYWRQSLSPNYVSEKLTDNEVDAESVCLVMDMIAKGEV